MRQKDQMACRGCQGAGEIGGGSQAEFGSRMPLSTHQQAQMLTRLLPFCPCSICMWELLTWQVPYHEYGPWQVVAMVTDSAKRPEVGGLGGWLGGCMLADGLSCAGRRPPAAVPCSPASRPASPAAPAHPTAPHLPPPPPSPPTPQVPVHEDLPTGTFSGEAEYLGLMHECWAQDPASRPTFTAVISRLRKMLALEASLRRESPTKVGRLASGYLTGEETPGSRLASLTAISDLSPDPRSSSSMVAALGEESDTDLVSNHSLSASPSLPGSSRPASMGCLSRPASCL